MIVYNIKNELNKTYFITGSESPIYNDYRFKMLAENSMEGIIPVDIRSINGETRLYYDITNKANLAKLVSTKDITYDELLGLTSAMMRVSRELRDYLLGEDCISFEPDMIFKDLQTGYYEFICIPRLRDKAGEPREDLISLMELIISHVSATDEVAVKAAYSVYESVVSGPMAVKLINEIVWEASRKEEEEFEMVEPEEDYPEEMYEDVPQYMGRYRLSFREWCSIGLTAAGLICIGLSAYLKLIK